LSAKQIGTGRLLLRSWRESDLEPWAAMNADPQVRRYLGPVLSYEQAAAWALNFQDHLDRYGFGFWALQIRASGEFVGFTGLSTMDDRPDVELGWRLARSAWGHGYATEAARAALAYGFGVVGLSEVLAVTMAENRRSRALMERLGMVYDPAGDFDDPDVEEESLRHHVVYRVSRGTVRPSGRT